MFDIVRSRKEPDIITDFVALGNLLNNTDSYHSAFIIKYNEELYEFHYTSKIIVYSTITDDYYHKITDTISSDEVPSFIALCINIKKKANPEYGYFYSGESYDVNGNHLCQNNLGERMTCVGFCLNVLTGFLEQDYLKYTDWSSQTHDNPGYLEAYCKENNIDPSKIKSSHRRITPREFLISGYFNVLPIRKVEIDDRKAEVEEHFLTRKRLELKQH